MITMFLPVAPFGKQRPHGTVRGGSVHMYTPDKTRSIEGELKFWILEHIRSLAQHAPYEGAVGMTLQACIMRPKTVKRKYPTVKPDIDNIEKIVCDAANGILWIDDCQIIEVNKCKRYVDTYEQVGIKISVYEIA